MKNPRVSFETLLRGPESGNRRTSRLLNEAETVQVSAKTIHNVNDDMWWLHLKAWTDATSSSLLMQDRQATWLHLLVNGVTLGVDSATTAQTDKDAFQRLEKGMIGRGLWLP